MRPTTSSGRRPSLRPTFLHLAAALLVAVAVATCSDDKVNGPSQSGRGYFGFRPVTHLSAPPSSFGIVIDTVHIRLTLPPATIVLDTTVFFPADSSNLHLSLAVPLEQQSETLSALIELKAAGVVVFSATQNIEVVNGPPGSSPVPTVNLAFVGPGTNIAHISVVPKDTAVALGDSIRYSATAVDSSSNPVTQFYTGWKSSDTTLAKINATGLLRAPNHRGSVRIIGTTPTNIADTTLVTFVPMAKILEKVSGDVQTGTVAQSPALPLTVIAKAADSLGVAGVPVRFSALSGGATVTDSVVVTDTLGHASTVVTLGTVAGPQKFVAQAGTFAPDTFTVTAVAGAPSAIAIHAGNAQTDTVGVAMPQPFAAKVTDAFGNAVTAAKVTWLRTAGGGTLATDTTASDTAGVATVGYTLGATPREDSVKATLVGTAAFVTFTVTGVPPAPTGIAIASGDAQSDTVGKALALPLVVTVTGSGARPVADARVAFSVKSGTGTFGGPAVDTVVTDTLGHAQAPFTLGTLAGTDSVQARTVAGGFTALFHAAALAGAPSAIAVQSGNAQTDTISTALPLPLTVRVTDAFSNAVTGAKVLWTRVGGGTLSLDSSFTAATGLTQAGYTLGAAPRTDTVTATIAGTGTFARMTAIAVPPAPSAIAILSGGGQTDTVGKALPQPFQVQLTGAGSRPVAGALVIFSARVGSALFGGKAIDTVATDTLGRAQAIVTLGTVAQADSFQAAVAGSALAPAVIGATAVPAAPSLISIVSGNAQSDTIGKALPLPLVVKVTDANANVVSGARVVWSVDSGAGSFTPSDTSTTNTLGQASVTFTLPAAAGLNAFRATLAGTSAFVPFTATGTSGAPSGISIVSGAAQTDTVAGTLALPLIVRVADGSNNPVTGAKVFWTRTTGTGTVSADSTVTDVTGHTQVTFTLGTAVGTDSVKAALSGGTNVMFGMTGTAGAATTIAATGGNNQTGSAGAVLASPLTVRVTDAHGNPVPGTTVTWAVTLGGGTLGGVSATTDATGTSSVGQWTMGAVSGTNLATATVTGLSGSPVQFSAVSLPLGTTKTWTGALGTAWNTAGSWSPSGVPLLSDNVFIPASAPSPSLTASASVGGLQLEAGATLTLNSGDTLTSLGTILIPAAAQVTGAGQLGLNGTTQLLSGTVANLVVSNTAQLAATTHVTGDVSIAGSGSLTVNGQALTVGGNVTLGGNGQLVMTGAADSVDVTGSFTAGGSSSGASLSAGKLVLRGGFAQLPTFSDNFSATGTHQTIFAGSTPQTLSFGNPGPATSHFANVAFANPAGVTLSSDFSATGGVTLTGNVNGTAHGAILAGGLADATASHWHVDTTSFIGGGALALPDSMSGIVAFAGAGVTLSKAFKVNGALIIGAGTFTPSGHPLSVAGSSPLGSLSLTGTGVLAMTNPADSVDVAGPFIAAGGSSAGALTAGTLVLRNSFAQVANFANDFAPSGTHRVVFAGTAAQAVIFANPGVGASNFHDVTFANPAGVVFGSNALVSGTATVSSGQVTGPVRAISLVRGVADAGFGWHPDTTYFTGNGAVIPDSMSGSVHVAAADSLTRPFKALGNLTVDGSGILVPNGNPLTVMGNFATAGSGRMQLLNALDSVDVHGNYTAGGAASNGDLAKGTLVLRGNFAQLSNSANDFAPSGTFKTVFAGSAAQTLAFANPGAATSYFTDVTFNSAGGVTLNTPMVVTGSATLLGGNVTGLAKAATIGSNLVDASNSRWHVDTTIFTGSPALPDSFSGSVHFQGTTTLAKSLKILGALTVDGSGVLTVNGHGITVTSGLTTAGGGQLLMTNALDSVDVSGPYTANSSVSSSGDLTAGTLVLRGAFIQGAGSSNAFSASGTHRTIFAGSAAQAVSFANAAQALSHFQDVTFNNAAGITLSTPMAATGSATVQTGVVTGAGRSASLGSTLFDAPSTGWQVDTTIFVGAPGSFPDSVSGVVHLQGLVSLGKALKVKGSLIAEGSAQLQPNGHPLVVTGALTLTGGPRFIMSSPTDSVEVGGLFSAGSSVSSAGDLTQGVLVLRGGLAQSNSTGSFAPSGSHRVIFAGGAAQALSFANPGPSGFNLVQFADAGGVTASTDFSVTSTAIVSSGTVVGIGHGATLQGALQDVGGNGWHVDTTTFTATPAAIPDSIHGVVHFQAPLNLSRALRVIGPLFVDGSNGVLTPNGFPLTVTGALHLAGNGQLRMVAAGDSVDVGGFVTATAVSGAGLDTTGILVVRGGFHQLSGGIATAFAPSGNHRTRLVTSNVDSVSFFNPSLTAGSHFNDLEFTAGGSTVVLGSDVEATGTITKASGAAPTLKGAGTLLRAMGLDLSGMVLDSVRLMKSGTAQVVRFDSVTFQHQDSTADQFTLVEGGSASPQTFNGIVFSNPVKFGTGHYIVATDSVENGQLVRINLNRSTPLYGGSFTQIVSPFEAAAVNWSGLTFATPPLDGITGIPLAPVRVALVGPLGDTLTDVADTVTAVLDSNPVGGTLTGTTSVPLVNGIATFNALTLTGVGTGYKLMFGANGFQPIVSPALNIDIQVPLGINAVWRGTVDSLWTNAANWQGGVLPDSTSDVFIPLAVPHEPYLGTSGFVHVNRLVLAASATFKADTFASVVVDSSLDNGGAITGGGTLTLAKAGTVRGIFNTVAVTGDFSVVPGSILLANRDLTVAGVGAKLDLNGTNTSTNGSLTVTSSGLLVMTHAADTLNVAGDATFSGGNEAGLLTAGRILLQGNFAQYGSSQTGASPTAFVAGPGHVTELLRGSGIQTVHFANPDTLASHLGSLVISGGDSVVFDTLAIALGNVSVTGTNAAVQSHDTLAVAGNLSTVAGSRLWLNGLGIGGTLNVSGAYHVGTTGFVGAGQTVPALPYDTIKVTGIAALGTNVAAARLDVGGPLFGSTLDLNGHTLTLAGDALIDTSGVLVMHSDNDTLAVAGNFSASGLDSLGKLTAGLIDVGGNFSQPRGSSAFVPSGTHTVRFNGGSHQWSFVVNGLLPPPDFVPSSFNHLEITGGATVDALTSGSITGNLTLTGSTLIDTTQRFIGDFLTPSRVGVLGNVNADATSSLQALVLAVGGSLTANGTQGQYSVGTTVFTGTGQAIPQLPYQAVEVDGTAHATSPLGMGALTIGNGTGTPGDFDPAGFPLSITGQLQVQQNSLLEMTNPADSVDVGDYVNFAGANSNGHLTAGTLVLRAGFVQNAGGNDSAFFATGTHRTIFTAASSPIIGIGYAGTRFNRLTILGTLGMQEGSQPLVAGDSLRVVQGGLVQSGGAHVTALGYFEVDSFATINVDTLDLNGGVHVSNAASYVVGRTRFTGIGQTIALQTAPLRNVDVLGTATLASLTFVGDTLTVTGQLDLGGQRLVVDSLFQTQGTGTLKMMSAADTLIASGGATFAGGSTAGLLTAGVLETPALRQTAATSAQSFAASGSHHLQMDDTPTFSGEEISFATPGAAASHPQNLVFNISSQLTLATSLYVADTIVAPNSDGSVLGNPGAVLTAAGPIVQSGFVNFSVDTLVLLHANPIQGVLSPSFWTPTVTRFAGTNQAIRDSVTYRTVDITGSAHVNFHASTDAIVVRGAGNLTINNGNIGTNGDFTTTEGGILTMDSAGSRLFVNGNATFGGGNTGGSLNAGEIQVGGDFTEQGNSTAADFSPLGTKVTLNGGVQQKVHFNQPGGSYFRDLDVLNSGGIQAAGVVTVTGNFTSNQPINGDTLAVFGTMTDTSSFGSAQIVLHALMLAGPTVFNPEFFYQVDRTHFLNPNPIPSLPYNDLVINAPITSIPNGLSLNNLYVAGPGTPLYQGSSSSASLSLQPGNVIFADTLDVEGGTFTAGGGTADLAGNLQVGQGGTLVMNQPTDSIFVSGNAIFGGNSTAGLLTDGTLILGGAFTQTGDPAAFAPSGNHLTEFQAVDLPGTSHVISFSNPTTSAFNHLRDDYADTLSFVNGEMDVHGRLTLTHSPFEPGVLINSLIGNGLVRFGGSDIHAATFTNTTAQFQDAEPMLAFDSVTFNAPVNNFTQFAASGPAGDQVTITNTFFTVIGGGNGLYVAATNTTGSGTFTVQAAQSNVSQSEFNAHTLGDVLLTIIQWLLPA